MYQYDEHDQRIVEERARQFRDQVRRRLSGELTEEEFRPLRLQNGLYLQLHAYMMRIAIPYGLLSTKQLRKLGDVARRFDRGYGHFTTRQNLQLNWPRLVDVPDILDELASVQMHAIQTSGNCIRNITSDPFAGVAKDELEDPRPYCEILRQWSTFHPEFAFLPRKFKIAISGAASDRAAIAIHDIGLRLVKNEQGEIGFEYFAGGGLGRTPILAERIRAFLPKRDLLAYTEAVLRVYNADGRRDNKFKARIKILVKEVGVAEFTRRVEEEFARMKADGTAIVLDDEEIARMKAYFTPPAYEALPDESLEGAKLGKDREYARWLSANVVPHRVPGYAIVQLSTKSDEVPPGDVSSDQMDAIADLADRYGFGQVVVTHRQNLVLPDVRIRDLREVHAALKALGFATPNLDRVTDIIACPGLDYCDLANARSIPIAKEIQATLDDADRVHDLGPLTINISGCINACGHHHVGNIGILGIDKQGEEFYQVTVGGSAREDAALGKVLGRALSSEEVAPAIARLVDRFAQVREHDEETFLEALRRLGPNPFKEALYAAGA
ncbi:nitrite/sulfite reductase [Sandaracinus amylolyticus]|uniref:Sulfite reductase [NADPH] hemoprotein beta-component n=1 Tax=Sandaracinus amylolyticus TaxID=927083 RepID=A0A0F6YIJ9_9BACT|nr:nitrite/sulfite reductase [Sandaracinus amylolyticus]AKF07110.1 Sulfite reductase [NADPH] hemoprotein beta-component [Sandaracinus amylolyticus]